MRKNLIILVICVLFLSIIPIAYTYVKASTSWQGVVPSFVNDDLYYYARMQNIVHGYPFIGNPYFFEHRQEMSPAFFVSDWLSAFPMKIGLPFIPTVVLNFVIWSMLFSVLCFFLFKKLSLSDLASVWASILTYATSYILILRPVSMQIVAPFFLLFCLAFVSWFKKKKPSRLDNLFLIFTTASSFYIYTYLWQIVLVVLGLTLLFLAYRKEWIKLKYLLINGFVGGILALPIVLYAFKQIFHHYYWEMMSRVGLVDTHLPTALSFYDGAVILVFILLWLVSFKWVESFKSGMEYKNTFIFVAITGIGLFVTLFSNVVTGKESEIAMHIDKFIIMWVSIALATYMRFLIKFRFELSKLLFYKKSIIILLFVFPLFVFVSFFINGFAMDSVISADTAHVQSYAEPLRWINNNVPKESVIWSNGAISSYIPINTTDFNLFNPYGGLHLVSSKEVEERYLVSHYFDDLTLDDIKKDFRQYAGVGNSVHQYKTYNRKVKICQILLSLFGVDCGKTTDSVSFKGEKYFIDLYDQYENIINPNIVAELKKFNVSYVIKDKENEKWIAPNFLKPVWSNNRFEIFVIQ